MRVTSRENLWHLRQPTTENYQWFRNLVDLHEITTHWIQEVQKNRPSYGITRGLSKEVTENLWMLDSLSDRVLEDFLDDTQVEDMLGRLEHTIWAVQAWTLSSLYNNSNSTGRDSLDNILEQISWKMGKTCVTSRWNLLTSIHSSTVPSNLPSSLPSSSNIPSTPSSSINRTKYLKPRDVLLALNDSPFSGYPQGDGFLIKRAVQNEVQIELRLCPHHSAFEEILPVADRLCRLHGYWIRGFAYGLNPQITIEHIHLSPRCVQKWVET